MVITGPMIRIWNRCHLVLDRNSSDAPLPGSPATTWSRVGPGTFAGVSPTGLVTALAIGAGDSSGGSDWLDLHVSVTIGYVEIPFEPLFEALVREQAREAASHEKVRAVRLVGEPFTVEDGLLTPTMKLKRRAIEARYAGLIAEMYDGEA